ncbi:unnamed protein product, partial [Effrenium voratum]
DLQAASGVYLQNLAPARNVYLYLTFDRQKPSKAFCGIYAPALSEAWVCFSGAETQRQDLERHLSELFSKAAGKEGDLVRTEVSFLENKTLSNLVLWAEQRLQEVRKHDGGCICIVSSQLSTAELRGLAPSCYVQQRALRNVTALREIPLCQAPLKQSKFFLDWPRTICKFFASSVPGAKPGALRTAAEAIAASLNGAPLASKQLHPLRDAFLAENADASAAAAERARSLRAGFAGALRSALNLTPGSAPKVRVEVRQTAGRSILSEVFTVGRAAECDVQTTGDLTASRLQFVAISLPTGLCICDAWSGGTRVVSRSGATSFLPASVPPHRCAFLLPHGERITLMTGLKTSVTVGPALKDVKVRQHETNGTPPEAPEAAPAPAPKAAPQAEPKAQAEVAEASQASQASAAGSGVCSRAINSMRCAMRAQQMSALKERLRGRLWAAERQRLLPQTQLRLLEERLSGPAEALEDIRDLLDGLGVAPAPDDAAGVSWPCSSCKASQQRRGWRCPFGHRTCRDCLLRLGPTCPRQACGYTLGLADLQEK